MLRRILIFLCLIVFLGVIFYALINYSPKEIIDNNDINRSININSITDTNNIIEINPSIDIKSDTNLNLVTEKNTTNIENKTYYFGYGSNMDIDLLRRRINNNTIIPESFAKLENYRLIFPRGVGSVIPDETTDIYGCLFLLTKEEIAKLDIVEGYREDRNKSLNSYNREWIDVLSPSGEIISAEIYIQTNNSDINGKPSNSYKQILVKGASDCSLPDFYKQELERIETR